MDSDNIVAVHVAVGTGEGEKSEILKNDDILNDAKSPKYDIIADEKCDPLKEMLDIVVVDLTDCTDGEKKSETPKKNDIHNGAESPKNDIIAKEKLDNAVAVDVTYSTGEEKKSETPHKDCECVTENGWIVHERITKYEDAITNILTANAVAVAKRHEINKIKSIVRLFGIKGATLPEICGTFDVLFNHSIDKTLLRETIANGELDEIPRTGRVYLQCDSTNYLDMNDLANDLFD